MEHTFDMKVWVSPDQEEGYLQSVDNNYKNIDLWIFFSKSDMSLYDYTCVGEAKIVTTLSSNPAFVDVEVLEKRKEQIICNALKEVEEIEKVLRKTRIEKGE